MVSGGSGSAVGLLSSIISRTCVEVVMVERFPVFYNRGLSTLATLHVTSSFIHPNVHFSKCSIFSDFHSFVQTFICLFMCRS